MRLVFTGAHSTGKSTLLKALVERYPPICTEHVIWDGTARAIHNNPKWTRKKKQTKLNNWYIWNHWKERNYIASRSIYDTLAYSHLTVGFWHHDQRWMWALKHINYNEVFYIPVEFGLVDDGERFKGEDFQQEVDQEIKRILDYHRVPYNTITGTVEDRVQQIANILGLPYIPEGGEPLDA